MHVEQDRDPALQECPVRQRPTRVLLVAALCDPRPRDQLDDAVRPRCAGGRRELGLPRAIAGDGDRAAVAFLGTRTAGDAQDQYFGMDPTHTRYTGADYHLYIATTYDRGRICLAGVVCTGPDRNLLDFMDIQVDRQGRVLVGWPDGCTLACVTSDVVAANSYSARGTVTRQTSGKGLFATP